MKNYGKTIIQIYENFKQYLSYKEEELSPNHKKTFTLIELFQNLQEKMEEYERKITSLQRKNSEYHLKYKIHECDVSRCDFMEKSEIIYPQIRVLFEAGEYNEGVELLKNANYQKSSKVSYEEMLNWLAISNRMKDIKLENMETKGMNFDNNNKENIRNENINTKEKKNKHLIISNQISRLMLDNQHMKKELEKEKNAKRIVEKNEENLNETHNKIVHQQIDNMKWGYIQQIKEFEKKILELKMEKDEFLLIIQELDRLANKQKEIISKNQEKFINLKKYSM